MSRMIPSKSEDTKREIKSIKININKRNLNLNDSLVSPNKTFHKRNNTTLAETEIYNSKQSIFNKTSFTKRNSICIYNGNELTNLRQDAYGNLIHKTNCKNYKVSFIDNVSRNKIAEIILIKNNENENNKFALKNSKCCYYKSKSRNRQKNLNVEETCKCDSCCII